MKKRPNRRKPGGSASGRRTVLKTLKKNAYIVRHRGGGDRGRGRVDAVVRRRAGTLRRRGRHALDSDVLRRGGGRPGAVRRELHDLPRPPRHRLGPGAAAGAQDLRAEPSCRHRVPPRGPEWRPRPSLALRQHGAGRRRLGRRTRSRSRATCASCRRPTASFEPAPGRARHSRRGRVRTIETGPAVLAFVWCTDVTTRTGQ